VLKKKEKFPPDSRQDLIGEKYNVAAGKRRRFLLEKRGFITEQRKSPLASQQRLRGDREQAEAIYYPATPFVASRPR